MTKMFQIGLALSQAYNDEKKRLLAAIPKDYMIECGDKWGRARELLISNQVVNTSLVPQEVVRTVVDGASPRKCAEIASPYYGMTTDIENVPLGGAEGYAPKVAPAAQIPQNNDEYDVRQLNAFKLAELPSVTTEMIDNKQWGVVNREYEMAGRRIANSINREWIKKLIDNAGLEHDTAGSNQGYSALNAARGKVNKANFTPDTVIVTPDAEVKLLADLVPSPNNPPAGGDAIKFGTVPSLGLKYFVLGVNSEGGVQDWAYEADGDIGMLVMDSFAGSLYAERAVISVEEYKDPIRDLVGAKVTWRGDPSHMQPKALCRVEY